ncbi:carboxymuconolactone decarboxylase family protein [Aneurinibacillus uraniidurans]|uniref:carboxymuconolactone decarboxylase family protein n=1 Tax=Aneurinibacillus uraniidurans TaxID=2966586 RepID=UPI0023490D94|nr:carboxymuconolactone decarboxylase family protein [Aneurinibacillus sp. B1]WCN39373.1 carboxymuconolactone decarboxylase family protein [Aneurinibacillus sp. B1]
MKRDDSLYKRSYFSNIVQMGELVPDAFRSFMAFDRAALAPGRLSAKTKELIAIAIAHITGCPYCIEVHVEGGREKGVTKEEMGEAIVVATALKAGAALAHGVNALNAYEGNGDDELYRSSYFKRLAEFDIIAPDGFTAFVAFDKAALDAGVIGRREKELIAVACAHATGCPYCIELHTKAAKREGIDAAELAEAIMVAAALKAGAALAHSVNALRV